MPATAATNALDHDADIAKVQEWLGHADSKTTQMLVRTTLEKADQPGVVYASGGALLVWVDQRVRKSVPLPDELRVLATLAA